VALGYSGPSPIRITALEEDQNLWSRPHTRLDVAIAVLLIFCLTTLVCIHSLLYEQTTVPLGHRVETRVLRSRGRMLLYGTAFGLGSHRLLNSGESKPERTGMLFRNAVPGPRRHRRKHSGAPTCQYPHRNGRSGAPMTLFQTTYNYYIFGLRRVQNLEATGPLGSLLRSLDPLVDGEIAAPSSRTSNCFQSWSQFLALQSSSSDTCRRRVMQKSLKALRGTEYCRYT